MSNVIETDEDATSLEIIAFFMMTGILSTYFLLPETKNKTLEELSNEDQRGFVSG